MSHVRCHSWYFCEAYSRSSPSSPSLALPPGRGDQGISTAGTCGSGGARTTGGTGTTGGGGGLKGLEAEGGEERGGG